MSKYRVTPGQMGDFLGRTQKALTTEENNNESDCKELKLLLVKLHCFKKGQITQRKYLSNTLHTHAYRKTHAHIEKVLLFRLFI